MQRVRSANRPANYTKLAIVVFILAIALFLILPGLAWVPNDATLHPGNQDTGGQGHTSLLSTPRAVDSSFARGQQFIAVGSTGFADVQDLTRRFS